MVNGSDLKLQDVYKLFVPSALTSGRPLCGNPAVGLRNWKRFEKIEAWGEPSK